MYACPCVCVHGCMSVQVHIFVCASMWRPKAGIGYLLFFLVEYDSMIVASLLALWVLCVCFPYIRIQVCHHDYLAFIGFWGPELCSHFWLVSVKLAEPSAQSMWFCIRTLDTCRFWYLWWKCWHRVPVIMWATLYFFNQIVISEILWVFFCICILLHHFHGKFVLLDFKENDDNARDKVGVCRWVLFLVLTEMYRGHAHSAILRARYSQGLLHKAQGLYQCFWFCLVEVTSACLSRWLMVLLNKLHETTSPCHKRTRKWWHS